VKDSGPEIVTGGGFSGAMSDGIPRMVTVKTPVTAA
jgi:hypothetical protein